MEIIPTFNVGLRDGWKRRPKSMSLGKVGKSIRVRYYLKSADMLGVWWPHCLHQPPSHSEKYVVNCKGLLQVPLCAQFPSVRSLTVPHIEEGLNLAFVCVWPTIFDERSSIGFATTEIHGLRNTRGRVQIQRYRTTAHQVVFFALSMSAGDQPFHCLTNVHY